MVLGIDHLVLAVIDPDAAAADLQRLLGVQATAGGRHDAHGTFNRIAWLGDSYLELIGVFDRARAEGSWIGGPALRTLGHGGGLATWAIRVDSIDAAVRAGRDAGVTIEGPTNGERVRPDGRIVRWRLAIAGPLGPGQPPFLIEHDASAAEWTPADRRERQAQVHPAGGTIRLAGSDVPVADPPRYLERISPVPGGIAGDDAAGAGLRLGTQVVRLVQSELTGTGPVPTPGSMPVVRLAVDAPIAPREVEWLGCRFSMQPVEGLG